MEGSIVDYFSNIFQSNGPTDTTTIVAAIQPIVTNSMNRYFFEPFQAEEIQKALKQMHLKKSPNPDDMSPLFYQHFWSLSGECITKAVLDFFNFGIVPPKFNKIHFILFPKVKNPTKKSKKKKKKILQR